MNSSTPKNKSLFGTVYCCATPIGALSDISDRLIDVLTNCHLVAAEDTRVAKKLLSHLKLSKPCLRLDAHTESTSLQKLLPLLETGQDIALLSDAGTLNICDPGAVICHQLHTQGVPLIPVLGPSSLAGFLSVCGIRADRFYFGGFFPRTHKSFLEDDSVPSDTLCLFFESPKRILKTALFLSSLPIREFFAIKEMSKSHESYWTSVSQLCKDLEDPSRQKGEWVLGFTREPLNASPEQDCLKHVQKLKQQGFSLKDTLYVATTLLNLPKNAVYDAYHRS